MNNNISGLQKIIEDYKKTVESLAFDMPKIDPSFIQSIKDIHSSMATSGFQKIMEDWKKTLENLAFDTPKIETSFIQTIKDMQSATATSGFQKIMEDYRKTFESLAVEVELEKINKKIENNIELEKSDLITFDRIIAIIGLLFTFYTYYFPDNSEFIEMKQMIENLEKKVIESNHNTSIYYEVTKQVHVRKLSNNSKESKIIDIALPKQKVLIINNQPYWLQVEYFNATKQETVVGWISKRYAKKLSNEQQNI